MLYLDQPVNVGLSYSELQNVTVSTTTGDIEVANFTDTVPEQNNTFYVGTYASQDANDTTQGTMNSARALWL
jgi:carboxypeptidase C (cathepsin A)